MIERLRKDLIINAKRIIKDYDPSHDMHHSLRVLKNAEYIQKHEGGDLEIIIPAAIFHDAVNYPKNDLRSKNSAIESAQIAEKILRNINYYNKNKIDSVKKAIIEHSYSNGIKPYIKESKIVQDADRLEATGAIAIMRTFCSTGQMKRKFYNPEDPFCRNHEPDPLNYAIDLFYKRLLKVKDLMNTKTAIELAEKRTEFLRQFIIQLEKEI
ncbi:HD domain-containing protein [Candidatus Woesearchaeota archaeon]|nr:HD domain-containing protein [Candidatus Woesearchaeota archaeon]